MATFLEILKYTLPSLIILGTVMVMGKHFLKQAMNSDQQRYNYEYRKNNSNVIVPAKLRANERLTLFIERISPESILGRFNIVGLTSLQLQQMLLQAVRDEYEHNISQQIYVQPETWMVVKNAREFMAQLINQCSLQCEHEEDAIKLAEVLLTTYSKLPETPISLALKALHNEVNYL